MISQEANASFLLLGVRSKCPGRQGWAVCGGDVSSLDILGDAPCAQAGGANSMVGKGRTAAK